MVRYCSVRDIVVYSFYDFSIGIVSAVWYICFSFYYSYVCQLCSSSRRLAGASLKTKRSYIDDVLSRSKSKFGDFVDLLIELERKNTTSAASMTVLYLDLHIEIDSEGRLRTNFTTKEIIAIFPL